MRSRPTSSITYRDVYDGMTDKHTSSCHARQAKSQSTALSAHTEGLTSFAGGPDPAPIMPGGRILVQDLRSEDELIDMTALLPKGAIDISSAVPL